MDSKGLSCTRTCLHSPPEPPPHPGCHITLSRVPRYAVGVCWLPVLNTAVCACPSPTPYLRKRTSLKAQNGHESEQTPGDGDGQGSLACCSPWGLRESATTERLTSNNKGAEMSGNLRPPPRWRRKGLSWPETLCGGCGFEGGRGPGRHLRILD